MFDLPFMQRALMAGVALGLILPFLGVFVTLRRMSFFGDGVAHATLAGVAIGILAGFSPFVAALGIGDSVRGRRVFLGTQDEYFLGCADWSSLYRRSGAGDRPHQPAARLSARTLEFLVRQYLIREPHRT